MQSRDCIAHSQNSEIEIQSRKLLMHTIVDIEDC